MKKSLMDADVAEATIRRITALTHLSNPHWGSMSSTQMLQHCRLVNQAILTGESSTCRPKLKQRFIKFLILNILGRLPKHIQQPDQLKQAALNEPPLSFEEERAKLIGTIQVFADHRLPDRMAHPAFGPLTPSEWGVFGWIHLAHHLTQFGV